MSNNNLQALRNHLFDVIERLKESNDPDADPKDTISLEIAKEITEAAKVIVNSSKIEVDFLRVAEKLDSSDKLVHSMNQTGFFLTDDTTQVKK